MGEHRRVASRGPAAFALVAWLAGCAVSGAALAGCDSSDSPTPLPSAPPARSVPVDSTEPGEIAEGKELAFGLPVPRDMRITARFPDAIYAVGKVAFEPLANYVRARVDAKHVDTGPTKTVFADATLKRDPTKRVRVEVSYHGGIAELVVRNRTRPPAEPGLSEQERWKRSGVTPDGRVLEDMNE